MRSLIRTLEASVGNMRSASEIPVVAEIKTIVLANQSGTLKAVGAGLPFLDAATQRILGLGAVLGLSLLIGMFLLWNVARLKTSVWFSHSLFVLGIAVSNAFSLFYEGSHLSPETAGLIFVFLVRCQFVFSAVMIFSQMKASETKQTSGAIMSGAIGCVAGASLLQFIWPFDLLVSISQCVLGAASLTIGWQHFLRESSKSLFFHLLIVMMMVFLSIWLPELKHVANDSSTLFLAMSGLMLIATAASLWSYGEEHVADRMGRIKREIYLNEVKLQKQMQMQHFLQANCTALEYQIDDLKKVHKQDGLRDTLRIKALQEMAQDIATGIIIYVREIEHSSHVVMNECKSPKYRLHRIRAFAERSSFLATKVKEVMGYLQPSDESQEGKLINAGDLLRECLRICHDKVVKNGIEMEIESYDNELWLDAKLSVLVQGFLGLLYNALEATATADIRKVTIGLRKVQIEDKSWVEMQISNSGIGIPTAIKAKAFHSKNKDGLGSHSLGLSMAFGVFESCGGSLDLDTEAVATTFVARLPCCEKDEEFSLRLAI